MADLIAAPATSLFASKRAVIRVCGDRSHHVGEQLMQQQLPKSGVTRGSTEIFDGEALPIEVWVFPAGASYTGDATIEIHLPGAPVVVEAMLARLRELGVRDAEAGEFTRRAYLNGRMDLAQSEAVMALVSSVDSHGAQRARRLLEGQFSKRVAGFVSELEMLCARFEVAFDFDEEAAEQVDEDRFRQSLAELSGELSKIRKRSFPTSAETFRVMLIGESNVGKSTLFNALLNRERAAVADEKGTTRDQVEELLTIEGMAMCLVDSAGLMQARDQIEAQALEALEASATNSDLVLLVIPANQDGSSLLALADAAEHGGATLSVIRTMLDRYPLSPLCDRLQNLPSMSVCAPRGDGVPEIRLAIAQALRERLAPEALPVSARASGLIQHADTSLKEALRALEDSMPLEVASDVARAALSDLRSFLGKESGSDVLDVVFASFCIGK